MSGLTCLSLSTSGSILIAQSNYSDTAATVGWVANPSGRGTVSLVLSCTLTLGLCVWSAMHLNIPSTTDTEQQIWWRNIRWTLMGVFGPELVMYVAWRQWSSSKALSAKVQERSLKSSRMESGEKQNEPIYPWTLVHSFYASMGGFVFDIDSTNEFPAFFPDHQRLTLTARGVALIAELGHLPNISKDDIADKSKADGLAKAFVCLQASWVVIQVVSRSAVGLPVTLLEVNTLGHAFCAFVIYILWWFKPRLIGQPTVLRGDWVRPVCAYMYMSSQISGWHTTHDKLLRMSWKEPEFNAIVLFADQTNSLQYGKGFAKPEVTAACRTFGTDHQESRSSAVSEVSVAQDVQILEQSPTKPSLILTDNLESYFKPRPQNLDEEESGEMSTSSPHQTAEEKRMQTLRWRLALEAVHSHPVLRERFPHLDTCLTSHKQSFKTSIEELVTRYSSNWPSPTLLKRSKSEGKKMGMALWCASMAYGAVHIAAWNYYFPSRVEAIMWRFSAICITASGLIWLLINGLAHKSEYWNRYWGRFVKMRCSWFSYAVIGCLSAICGIAYCAAAASRICNTRLDTDDSSFMRIRLDIWEQVSESMEDGFRERDSLRSEQNRM